MNTTSTHTQDSDTHAHNCTHGCLLRRLSALLIGLLLCLWGGQTALANTITVTNTADSGAGSLRQAILVAASNDTIVFTPTLASQTITLTSGALTVTKTLILDGSAAPDVAISGNNISRVISSSQPLTLTSLIIQNGLANVANGGAIFANSNLWLINNQIRDSKATGTSPNGQGGGVYVAGSINVAGTTFANNSAGSLGGGVMVLNAAEMTDATFFSNTATLYGGGLYANQASNITGTSFISNNALVGGGVYLNNTTGMTATVFLSNTAGAFGGGAYLNRSANVLAASFAENSAQQAGGGLYLAGSTAKTSTVINSLFVHNRSLTHEGDALYMDGIDVTSRLELLHNTLGNAALKDGSAIYVASGSMGMTNTIVASHTIAIQNAGGTVSENYTLFDNISVPYSGTISAGSRSITGTAGFFDTTSYTLTSSSAALNAGANAGITRDYFGDVRPLMGGFDIGYDEYEGTHLCFASLDGVSTFASSVDSQALQAAVMAVGNGGTVHVAGYCAGVSGNGVLTQVLAITQPLSLLGGYETISGTGVVDWRVRDASLYATTLDALGVGRVISTSQPLTVTHLIIQNGLATNGNGGGIYANSSLSLISSQIRNGVATGNTPNGSGGGAYISGTASITGSIFVSNSANVDGGAAWLNTDNVITNTTFSGNRAVTGSGGALRSKNNALLSGSAFVSNQAGNAGGGISHSGGGASEFVNLLFAANKSSNGNAMLLSSTGSVQILHNTIASDTVVGGTAIRIGNGTVMISNTLIASSTIGIQAASGSVSEDYNLYSTVATPFAGVLAGANSITGTALFVASGQKDFHLRESSPGIDAAANMGVATDYDGEARPYRGGFDIGFDENYTPPLCFTSLDGTTTFASSADSRALRVAVAAAGSDGTVHVAGYCAGVSGNGVTQVLAITQPLSLLGGYQSISGTGMVTWSVRDFALYPTTLDALTAGRVISTNQALTVTHLVIQNGLITDSPGGGIFADSDLWLVDSLIRNNATSDFHGYGGGVYIRGLATVTGTTFQDNHAGYYGGGLYAYGNLSLAGSIFMSNTALAGGGAVIDDFAYIVGSTFQANQAAFGGGGLYASAGVDIASTTFQSNHSDGSGGGLAVVGTVHLSDGRFISNTAGDSAGGAFVEGALNMEQTLFEGNTAQQSGGGLYLAGDADMPMMVLNSLFTRNRSLSNEGDAICMNEVNAGGSLELLHSTLANPSMEDGAAIYIQAGTVGITNTLVASHTIAIQNIRGTIYADYDLFDRVTAPYRGTVEIGAHTLTGTVAFYDTTSYTLTSTSAAINAGVDVELTRDYFGDARPQQGGFDVGYDESPYVAYVPPNCFTSLDGSTTYASSADSQALQAAVSAASSGSTVHVAGYCAGVSGDGGLRQLVAITQPLSLLGGYQCISGTGEVNWAVRDAAHYSTILDALVGGRVIRTSQPLTVTNLIIQRGWVTNDDGGGIYAEADLWLIGSQINDNTATSTGNIATDDIMFGNGGGVYGNRSVTITDTSFLRNTAGYDGGGLYVAKRASMSGASFLNNSAANDGGGAITDGPTQVTDTDFLSNTAANFGGGLDAGDHVSIVGTRFEGNTSVGFGGGLSAISADVSSTTFFSNSVVGMGGGLSVFVAANVEATLFQANVADFGGGVFARDSINMTRDRFLGNTSKREGGALYLFGNSDLPTRLVNVLLANNHSSTNIGDGVYMDGVSASSRLEVLHSTFANSVPEDGVALVVNDGSAGITNTIVANHTTAIQNVDASVSLDYDLFDNVTTPYSGTVGSGPHMITGTAGFLDASTNDFHVGNGSAAINAGVDTGVDIDFDGEARPQANGFDIGFDETAFAPILSATSDSPVAVDNAVMLTATLQNGGNFSYTWSFGDDSPTAMGVTATHHYTTGGLYTATVTAINAVSRITATVEVQVLAPNAPTPTPTPSETASPTATAIATATATATATPTSAATGMGTATPTSTSTPTATSTPTPTPSRTSAPTPTPTTTATGTPTAFETVTPTPTETALPSATVTPSPTPSAMPTVVPSISPTPTAGSVISPSAVFLPLLAR